MLPFTNFNMPLEDDTSAIVPPNLYDEKKPFFLIEVSYCEINETASKHFIKTFHEFTNEKYDTAIKWITQKVKSLFKVKDRNLHPSCKKVKCKCGEIYVGETVRNMELSWAEHNNINKKSEPSKHLFLNSEHGFKWSVLLSPPENTRARKNLEAFFIAKMKLNLNEHVGLNTLSFFVLLLLFKVVFKVAVV